MNQKFIHPFISLIAVILLAGCGSSGLGDILGGGSDGTVRNQQSVVSGTVDRVDTRNQTIVLRNANTRSSLQNRGSGTETVHLEYDNRTVVEHRGQTYRPEALEPGDRIEASTQVVGNRLVAERINVTYDVSGSGTGTTGSSAVTDIRGTITNIDTRSRTITVEQQSWTRAGQTHRFTYERNTPVYWQGRVYQADNLERGDVIDVDLRQSGNTLIAQKIEVIESSTSTRQSSTRFEPDLRGTVLSVDTRANTITVQQPTWMQRFDTGTNTGNNVTLRYDSSTTVEYKGQFYGPENLERGDQIEVDVTDLGRSMMANAIVVISDVRQSRY